MTACTAKWYNGAIKKSKSGLRKEITVHSEQEGACLICGAPIVYFDAPREMECMICHKKASSHASCSEGHFVCDACHGKKGITAIIAHCMQSGSRDPIALLQEMMEHPSVYMHGPEHHVMVGAALLTAYRNAGGETDLAKALGEMAFRGGQYPGGSCGYWGSCGAAVSAGMFLSIATGTTPLSGESWGLCNRLTAACLEKLGTIGGPRCCKRNSFTAALTAAEFVKEHLGVSMDVPEQVACTHSARNKQCLKSRCPYYRE